METPQDLPEEWMNHPVIQEMLAQLSSLTVKITEFEKKYAEVKPALAQAQKNKDDFLASIQQQLKEYDKEIIALVKADNEITSELNNIKSVYSNLQGEVGVTIAGLEAHAELIATQAVWDQIMSDNDWLWVKSIFDYQKIGCEFITTGLTRDLFGVLLADQPGLGKTLQVTAAINLIQHTENFEEIIGPRCPRLPAPFLHPKSKTPVHSPAWYSVLYCCPKAIAKSSAREIRKWSKDLNVMVLEGTPVVREGIIKLAHEHGMVLICSYEQLRQYNGEDTNPELFKHDWPIVVMDEAHNYKNRFTSTFVNMKRIVQNAGYIVPMTGTPILNRPEELWPVLNLLTMKGKYEGKFHRFEDFEARYLNTYSTGKYSTSSTWASTGTYDRLVNGIKDMVLRRRKDEVLTDLPDKIREVRFVELAGKQAELYTQMREEFRVWLDADKTESVGGDNFLAQLTRLRQIALLPSGVKIVDPTTKHETILDCWESAKCDEAMHVVRECLEADEKVLIFSNFTAPLEYMQQQIAKEFGAGRSVDARAETPDINSGAIMGTSKDDKDVVEIRFNDKNDSMKVLVGTIKAMGTGKNLQESCSHVIFLDLFWNPGTNEQAEDRLHRQGQKNNVTVHIIQAENSVDGFIAKKLEEKLNLIEGVIEREELRQALKDGLI